METFDSEQRYQATMSILSKNCQSLANISVFKVLVIHSCILNHSEHFVAIIFEFFSCIRSSLRVKRITGIISRFCPYLNSISTVSIASRRKKILQIRVNKHTTYCYGNNFEIIGPTLLIFELDLRDSIPRRRKKKLWKSIEDCSTYLVNKKNSVTDI